MQITKFLLVAIMMSVCGLGSAAQAATAPAGADTHASRYFLVKRSFIGRVYVPASEGDNDKDLQQILDSAMMTPESLRRLAALPGVESVQSFIQENWRSRADKRIFAVWGVPAKFFDHFGLAKSAAAAGPAGALYASTKALRAADWKSGAPLTLEDPSPLRRQFSGHVVAFDSPITDGLADSSNLLIVPLDSMMKNAPPAILNPRMLIKIKRDADSAAVRARLEAFITKEAEPALKGSVLHLKTIDASDI